MKQAMIFAAGLGTRLKPLTDTMPKALVSVGGQPLLQHVVFRLRDAGFTRLVVNVHHFSQQIKDYLQTNDSFGLDIRVSDETAALLDTGGGLRKAAPLLDAHRPLLIHNVDTLRNVDLARFYALDPRVACPDCGVPHRLAGAQLLVSWRRTRRYLLFDDRMLLVGWVNVETGEVKSPYPEVARAAASVRWPLAVGDAPMRLAGLYRMCAFSGIHSFSPLFFPYMAAWPERFAIMDFYLRHCREVPVKGHVEPDLQLMDVGKLGTLDAAEAFAQQLDHQHQIHHNT